MILKNCSGFLTCMVSFVCVSENADYIIYLRSAQACSDARTYNICLEFHVPLEMLIMVYLVNLDDKYSDIHDTLLKATFAPQ